MRTTVTLDADTQALIRKRMRERGVSFKEALNDAIRAGLAVGGGEEFRTETAAMGPPRLNLTHALRIAAELEDEDPIRKAQAGK